MRLDRRPAAVLLALALCACAEDKDDDDDGGDDTAVDTGDHGDTDTDGDSDTDVGGDGTEVTMVTSLGTLVIELDAERAPITTENFLAYAESGYFDGADGQGATIFHRVIDGFVAQGGGYTVQGALKSTLDPIPLESDVGLSNRRGTIAMARTNDPDSATSQFYFNLVDNPFLDYQDASNPGYAVFGEITEGLDVMDAIGGVATGGGDQPVDDVVIEAVSVR
jgi:peptidyl-prolyl cis-trans isomerase B (cyclophilin B)